MTSSPKVISTNISEKKGTIKTPVDYVYLNNTGVKGDAHAGMWNRQVSLLAFESIKRFEKEIGRDLECGEFAENITTAGIELHKLKPLDMLEIGECQLEITQIGKTCHGSSCDIFKATGDCVMPKEGIFGRVVRGGEVRANDEIVHIPKEFKIKTITLSDRASKGIYKDVSGEVLGEELETFFKFLGRDVFLSHDIIPDDEAELRDIFNNYRSYDMIFTTGGTGIGHRDITIDVVSSIIDKEIPGIMEMIRMKYGQEKPNVLLSRSLAGVVGLTLVYCLPGNAKAVKEYCSEIFKTLEHAIYMLFEIDKH